MIHTATASVECLAALTPTPTGSSRAVYSSLTESLPSESRPACRRTSSPYEWAWGAASYRWTVLRDPRYPDLLLLAYALDVPLAELTR